MYRSKKGKSKKSDKSATAEIHDAAADAAAVELAAIKKEFGSAEGGTTAAKSHPSENSLEGAHRLADAASAQAIVNFKVSFTTPSMVFNPSTKAIEVNAQFDRNAVTELSRAQGAMLSVLRNAEAKAKLHTPKELLYRLEQAVLFLLASTAVPDNQSSLGVVSAELDADQKLPMLENFFAHHAAPAKSIAATAYALSEGISKRAVESFTQMLKARIEQEADPVAEKHRSPEESKAFAATRNNVTDFTQILSNFLVAYEGVPRAASSANPSLSNATAISASSQLTSAELLSEAYYSLVRWVLAVDPERQSLLAQQQHRQVPPAAAQHVTVDEYDPYEGRITLSRPTSATPWGCMFNGNGYLVGISNDLRNSSEAGARLFRALQQRSGSELGLPVLEANRRRIRPQTLSEEELQSQRGNITTGLRDSLTSDAKVLHLSVPPETQESLTAPREVLFELVSQGGENVSGQRAFLVLRRANTTIPWGVKMVKDSVGGLRLQEFSDHIRLSPTARDFLFEHRGGLTIVGLNHKDLADHPEAATGAALREMISNSLVMALWIQVSRGTDALTQGAATSAAAVPSPVEEEEEEEPEEVEAPEETAETDAAKIDADDVEESEAIENANEDAPDEEKLDAHDAEDEAEIEAAEENLTDEVAGDDTTETVADAATTEVIKDTAQTISSIRKGWELDDDAEGEQKLDAEPTEPAEGGAGEVEENEHRELLQEHGVAAEADNVAHAVDGDEQEEVLEGQSGFANAATPKHDSTDIETAVQDILDAEGNGDLIDAEGEGVKAVEEGEAAPKTRGRKPGSKNAAKSKTKKDKKGAKTKGKGKRGRKAKSQPLAEEEEETGDLEAEEADEADNDGKEATEEEKEAVEMTGENKTSAEQKEVVDTTAEEPLVKGLKTTAEIAIEEGEKLAGKRASAKAKRDEKPDDGETRMSIADLVDAEPLVFPNRVTMTSFDGTNMELTRPDVSLPWQIKVGFAGDEMVLTGLPAHAGDAGVPGDHPYLKYLEPFANAEKGGKGRCLVESVNGTDLSTVTKSTRHRIFDIIKSAPKLNMVVKFIRKR